MKKSTTIYCLYDPTNGSPKYVGTTNRYNKIKDQHPYLWVPLNNEEQLIWLRGLIRNKMRPELKILAQVLPSEVNWTKTMFIKSLIEAGWDLFNRRKGIKNTETVRRMKELWKTTSHKTKFFAGQKAFKDHLIEKQTEQLKDITPLQE